jgi:D-alanyl-D-alanine carboxypeptidase
VEQWQDKVFSDPQRIWTPEELVRFGIADSPAFAPGTEFQYSNTNTALLGLVLEQVSGKPNGDLYREGIIEPLGLLETSFPNTDPSLLIRTRRATPSNAKTTERSVTLPTGPLPGDGRPAG